MKQPGPVPAVIPWARIVIGEDDRLTVTVDGAPFPVPQEWAGLGSLAIGQVMEAIAAELGQIVRVDVVGPDGTADTEILTPEDVDQLHRTTPDLKVTARQPIRRSTGDSFLGIAEHGFRPREPVSVAVIVATAHADDDGVAALRLPPGLLARKPLAIILLGSESGALFTHGATGPIAECPDHDGASQRGHEDLRAT